MSKDETRTALIQAGRRIILESGYNSAGVQAILAAAGVPKGSFYYYFPSKEAFGLAVLDDFAAENRASRLSFLQDVSKKPLTRLRDYFEARVRRYEESGFSDGGCLLGNLGEEMAAQNEAFREPLEAYFAAWRADIAACLREAQAAGEVPESLDPTTTADFALSGWQGAILRSKVVRGRAPFDAFLAILFGSVLARR